jgi:hypothetical protein
MRLSLSKENTKKKEVRITKSGKQKLRKQVEGCNEVSARWHKGKA